MCMSTSLTPKSYLSPSIQETYLRTSEVNIHQNVWIPRRQLKGRLECVSGFLETALSCELEALLLQPGGALIARRKQRSQ